MRANVHRGRSYNATSHAESSDAYRGVFDIDSSSEEIDDGVINEATSETYPTREAAEQAADEAAVRWIDAELDKVAQAPSDDSISPLSVGFPGRV